MNHEKTITMLGKAILQIADSLPRVRLATMLYPTGKMRIAVEELYAHILRFLMRAHDWYRESSLRHIINSIIQPPELRYVDLLDRIQECSRRIDQLCLSGSQAELRDMHNKLDIVVTKLERSDADIKEMAAKMIGKIQK